MRTRTRASLSRSSSDAMSVLGLELLRSWGTLPSFRLTLKRCSTILHSWSAEDLRNIELILSGTTAVLSLFLTWTVLRDWLEQEVSFAKCQ